MKEYLTQTKRNKKTLSIQDFSKLTSLAVNLNVKEWLVPNCKKERISYNLPTKVVRGYYVANRMFVLCADSKLYEFDGTEFVYKFDCGVQVATLAKIMVKGEEKILVVTPSNAVILGDTNKTVSVPYGVDICTYNGRIFVANNNSLYFGKEYDFVNSSVQTGDYDIINLDEKDGQILRIFDYDKGLLIVCEKALYKLTVLSNYDYELNSIYDQNLLIEQGSVCDIDGLITFISGNRLCVYKKGNVSVVHTIIGDYQLYMQGVAQSGNGKYYLPVTSGVDNQNYIYVYDTVRNKECLTDESDCVLCGGEYYVDNSDGYFGKISLEKDTNLGGKWISKKIDFYSNAKKTLLSLSIYLDYDAHLLIKGDFGVKEYSLKKGYCKKILNLYSYEFIFEISFDNGNFKGKNLQLEYSL